MCRECVVEWECSRQRSCFDTGAYLANFRGCVCRRPRLGGLKAAARTEDDDGTRQDVVFDHVCVGCDHVVAQHEYSFEVSTAGGVTTQCFTMTCGLCGRGVDEKEFATSAEPVQSRASDGEVASAAHSTVAPAGGALTADDAVVAASSTHELESASVGAGGGSTGGSHGPLLFSDLRVTQDEGTLASVLPRSIADDVCRRMRALADDDDDDSDE
jgi:hypothetical protein